MIFNSFCKIEYSGKDKQFKLKIEEDHMQYEEGKEFIIIELSKEEKEKFLDCIKAIVEIIKLNWK
ncbi:MAG: hypothetical protein NC915_06805 [Candidatus Omnitrophica bacterium]|nr:hypothetical protein [Candidatus Omnitrophota bacterium]